MQELFEDCVKDIYSAEKQLAKALPKLAKTAKNPRLKEAFTTHLEETNIQIKRIEECAKALGIKPTGMVCKGMQGLIEEANEHIGEEKPGPVTDAMLIGLAQKNEHYEIASYGTMLEYAKCLGIYDQVQPLKENMSEEEKTDKLLTELAETEINPAAAQAPAEEPKKAPAKKPAAKSASASKSTASKSGGAVKSKVSVR
jgi:ferritin-like metal-binding protein YciE